MFPIYQPPTPYSSRSAREIELQIRKTERLLELQRMEEGRYASDKGQKKNLFNFLATILFS